MIERCEDRQITGDDEMASAASRAVIDVAKDWIKVYQRGGDPCSVYITAGLWGANNRCVATRGSRDPEDRLLLGELGRLNTDVVPLAMRIIDESATAEEHYTFAERLAAMARRLQDRAAHLSLVIDGEVVIAADQNVNSSADTVYHRDL
jgi:hypothetical protein